MKVIGYYKFSNEKAFQMVYLSAEDAKNYQVPECDTLGLRRVGDGSSLMVMRPDEALILARLLIDAVYKTCSAFEVQQPV